MARQARTESRVEERTQEIGRDLLRRLVHRAPTIFHGRWWEDRLLAWAIRDDSVRIQMLRIADVLPMLRDHTAIARHLDEYFEEVSFHLPGAVRLGISLSTANSILSRALAFNARTNAGRMARRFVAGSNGLEIIQSMRRLRRSGYAFVLTLSADTVVSEVEADRYQQHYIDLMLGISEQVNEWPEDELLDNDMRGPIPRTHLSLKLPSLDSRFSNVDAAGTMQRVLQRLRPILRTAMEREVHVMIDVDRWEDAKLTFEIFRQVLMEDEFRDWQHAGISIQAWHTAAAEQLSSLLEWVKQRNTPITVRLDDEGRREYEQIVASQRNVRVPVHRNQSLVDAAFESLTSVLLGHSEWLRPVIASHNLRSLAHALSCAEVQDLPYGCLEIQMQYGVSDEHAQLFREHDQRVRIAAPFGRLIPGFARLARRLLENPSRRLIPGHASFTLANQSPAAFLNAESPAGSSMDNQDLWETLLMNPAARPAEVVVDDDSKEFVFRNEPRTDFSAEENREAMLQALAGVREELGGEYPLIIDGKACDSRATLVSRNPSRTSEILGRVASASVDQAFDAIDAARRAFPQWAAIEDDTRAEYLELVAAEMRERRLELAAWIVCECGQPWIDADADVAEAIDYCMYYAQEMRRLAVPTQLDLPGEENSYSYRPRGVAVVIAPWNSPLAVLTSMTMAAVVTGNTVIMKPAEQASIVAARFMEIIRNAHLPDGVVNFLPGIGEDLGPTLAGSPDVDLVVFTGSQPVGMEVNRVAADTDDRQRNIRRVIADMSGKNAIIVDDDADLDEAVSGVIRSAFGYAGQRCAACSRVIVLNGCYDLFVQRLVEAAASLQVGMADDPATQVGPVIDDDARALIMEVLGRIDPEVDGTVALAVDVSALAKQGTFVGPHILIDVDPASQLAQTELFGPVLAVIRAKTIDEAFQIANSTKYSLAGGVYSRSPKNLRRARVEFEVGSLFLNRELTGGMVYRHPFGGYGMSGTGAKAGGPDYLLQFVVPVNISENTSRRGFDTTEKAPAAAKSTKPARKKK